MYDHARNGRSTKSFYDEGLWAPVEAALCPGDLLLMQFGHNDEKSPRTPPATPRLISSPPTCWPTPTPRRPRARCPCSSRRWCAAALRGALWFRPTVLTPDAVRLLAAREDLPLIDLSAASAKLVQEMGEPASRELYMVFAPNLYPNYPDGKEDNTHLRYLGAVRFTGLVAAGLQALGGPYADVLLGTPERDKYDGKGYEG